MKHYATKALRILVAFLVAGSALLPMQMHAATNLPPVFTSAPPSAPVIAGHVFSYSPVVTDPDGDTISFIISKTFSGMSLAPDGTITWTPKYVGTYNAEIRAQDSFGNTASQIIPITVVHGDMTTIKNSPVAASLIAGQSVSVNVTAYDSFQNSWDVSSSATLTSSPDALGTLSGLTYASEKAGVWQLTTTVETLHATTNLTVAQGSIQAITTTPSQSSTSTDQPVTVSTKASDAKGNSWDVSGFTQTTSSDPKGSVSKNIYQPHTAGTQQVTTKLNSFTVTNTIAVTPGSPASLSLHPSGLISLALHAKKLFSASLADQYGNLIATPQCNWSLSNTIGTLSQNGEFIAQSKGTTMIQVAFAGLTDEVPVSVDADSVTAATVTAINNIKTPQVKGETVTQGDNAAAVTTSEPTTKTDATQTCSVPALWIVLIILAAYELILAAYFLLTKNEQDSTWWIFPVLLTIIGLIIWNKYFCSQFQWWPWTIIGLGIVTTVLLERNTKKPAPPTAEQKQPPMF